MLSLTTRRDFLKTTAIAAAALPATASLSGVVQAAVAPSRIATSPSADADLLRTVGERIGLEAAELVAPNGEAVSLMYLDYAGPAVDPLREGIVRGLSWQSEQAVAVNEIGLPYGALLGVAIVRNLSTAVETRIEINAEMLSHLAWIEETAPTAGIAKSAILSAEHAHFYRVASLV